MIKRNTLIRATGLSSLALTSLLSLNAHAINPIVPYKLYKIQSAQTGYCLNYDGINSKSDDLGTRACNGSVAQSWYFVPVADEHSTFIIRNNGTAQCLDDSKNTSGVGVWDCHEKSNQQWDVYGGIDKVTIFVSGDGKCMVQQLPVDGNKMKAKDCGDYHHNNMWVIREF